MMKRVLLFLLLTAAVNAYGSESSVETVSKQPTDEQVPPDTGSQQSEPSIPRPKEEWPKPFTPSERIGADSVVSFPVDI